ncbi:MAG: bifunctional hydroxymethylpyrimidine kinase/phosphomethylpyrimidine kinase [Candidatus Accumulibacter sp.]|jgi:hydroxymethylpyrimidine/phosphomethylpyrimidine kinase|nr:bifunctional hydroxymethylpyrimidine kinase/phosphomethylpyrimidine kinase [Accumulibacter sp.]
MFPAPPVVLTFAASDPSGGAGLQADVMTLSAFGCHALSVLTAVTAQDTRGIAEIQAVSASLVEKQARVILEDIHVDAFKIGVTGSTENIHVIARILAEHAGVPVVLDPVLASGRGDPLSGESVIAALRDVLLPLTLIATPNTLEARRLAAADTEDENTLPLNECARRLLACGCPHVLLTGTHENSENVTHRLFDKNGLARSSICPRLPGDYHGSGCTLASALAAGLAHGLSVGDAASRALDFTWNSLANAFRLGKGQLIPSRMTVTNRINDAKIFANSNPNSNFNSNFCFLPGEKNNVR